MHASRLYRWFGFLLVSTLAAFLITDFVLDSDKAKSDLVQFLSTNAEVSSRIGNVKEAELIKRVSVEAGADSGAYRLYTFVLNGEKASARVTVRAEQSESGAKQENFMITKFDTN